jgi:uncharacterized membrane-anchored protein YhcB (DUF1043 family)
MTGDPFWAWVGVALVVVGIALGFVELRSRRASH